MAELSGESELFVFEPYLDARGRVDIERSASAFEDRLQAEWKQTLVGRPFLSPDPPMSLGSVA